MKTCSRNKPYNPYRGINYKRKRAKKEKKKRKADMNFKRVPGVQHNEGWARGHG